MALRSSIKILSSTPHNIIPWNPALAQPTRKGLVAVHVPLEHRRKYSIGKDIEYPTKRLSCDVAEPAPCPPTCVKRRPCCRLRYPKQPPVVRVRCCPPGVGCRPPCAPSPPKCPVTCLNRCIPDTKPKSGPQSRNAHSDCRRHTDLDPKEFKPPPEPKIYPNQGPYSSKKKICSTRPDPIVCKAGIGRTCSDPTAVGNTNTSTGRQRRDETFQREQRTGLIPDDIKFEDKAYSLQIDRVARRLTDEAADRRRQYELEARIHECHRRMSSRCADDSAQECQEFLKEKCMKEKCWTEECRNFCDKCQNPHPEDPGHGFKLDATQTIDATGIDGKMYSLRPLPCEKWGEMKKCGPNRETPPPESIRLKYNQCYENCEIKDKDYVNPCAYKPLVVVEVDRATDPKVLARNNDKKIGMKIRKNTLKNNFESNIQQEQQKPDKKVAKKSKAKKGFTDRIKEFAGCTKKKEEEATSNPAEQSQPDDKNEGSCDRTPCKPSCNEGENPNLKVGDESWCKNPIQIQPFPEKCIESDFKEKIKYRNVRGKCFPLDSSNVAQEHPKYLKSDLQINKRSMNKPTKRQYHTSGTNDMKICGTEFFQTKKQPKTKTFAEILKQAEEDIKKFKKAMAKRDALKELGVGRLLGEDMCPLPPKEQPKPCIGPSLTGSLKIQMPCEPDDKQIKIEMCIDNKLLAFKTTKDPCSGNKYKQVDNTICPKRSYLPTTMPCSSASKEEAEKSKPGCGYRLGKLSRNDHCIACQKLKERLKKKTDTGKKEPPSHNPDCPCSHSSKSEPSLTMNEPKTSTIDSIKSVFKSEPRKEQIDSLCKDISINAKKTDNKWKSEQSLKANEPKTSTIDSIKSVFKSEPRKEQKDYISKDKSIPVKKTGSQDTKSKSEQYLKVNESKCSTLDSIKSALKSEPKKEPRDSLCKDISIPAKKSASKDTKCKFSIIDKRSNSNLDIGIFGGQDDVPQELSTLLPQDYQDVLNNLVKYEEYIDRTEKLLKASENENLRKASAGQFAILKGFLCSKFAGSSKIDAGNDPIVW